MTEPSAFSARFGRNLADARTRASLSQEQLAKRAGLHRTEVGMVERGARTARIDTLVKLAGALQVPPGHLLVGLDWQQPPMTEDGGFDVAER